MRTTLTIDDDNAVRLERLRKTRDSGLKELVNDAIRHGLNALEAPAEARKPFRFRVLDAGKPLFETPQELKDLVARIDEEEDAERLKSSA